MIDVLALMRNKVFKPGGRGPREYDCFGLCIEVYRQFGLSIPLEVAAPVENKERDTLFRSAMADPKFLRLDKPEVPCLIALMVRPPYVTHVGTMIGTGEFIHISDGPGVTVTSVTHRFWKDRIAGFYRYMGDAA